jgi:hypothetical protein
VDADYGAEFFLWIILWTTHSYRDGAFLHRTKLFTWVNSDREVSTSAKLAFLFIGLLEPTPSYARLAPVARTVMQVSRDRTVARRAQLDAMENDDQDDNNANYNCPRPRGREPIYQRKTRETDSLDYQTCT